MIVLSVSKKIRSACKSFNFKSTHSTYTNYFFSVSVLVQQKTIFFERKNHNSSSKFNFFFYLKCAFRQTRCRRQRLIAFIIFKNKKLQNLTGFHLTHEFFMLYSTLFRRTRIPWRVLNGIFASGFTSTIAVTIISRRDLTASETYLLVYFLIF